MRFFLLFLLLCASVHAHGFGNTQTVMSNDHRIEFGITEQPVVGKRVGMSLSIDDPSNTPIAAPKATVRISKGDDIYFISDGFRLSNETILTMSFIFPQPGEYTVDLTAGEDSASFNLEVEGGGFNWIHAMLIGVLTGALLMWLIKRK